MIAFLHAAWPLIWHYGLAGAICAVAIVAYFTAPSSPAILKQAALAVAIGSAIFAVGYFLGDGDGRAFKQHEWDRANQQAIEQATRDRKDADLSIPELSEADRAEDRTRAAVGKPCVVRDAWDRDCH